MSAEREKGTKFFPAKWEDEIGRSCHTAAGSGTYKAWCAAFAVSRMGREVEVVEARSHGNASNRSWRQNSNRLSFICSISSSGYLNLR
jgi:hypothetical protein